MTSATTSGSGHGGHVGVATDYLGVVGGSEISVALVVDENELEHTVLALHELLLQPVRSVRAA